MSAAGWRASRTGRAGGHLHPIFSLPSPDLLHASFSCCFFPILRRPWVPPGTSLSCFGTQGVHLFPQPRGHWIHGSASGLGWLCAPARAPAQTVYTCTSGMQLATQLRRGRGEAGPKPSCCSRTGIQDHRLQKMEQVPGCRLAPRPQVTDREEPAVSPSHSHARSTACRPSHISSLCLSPNPGEYIFWGHCPKPSPGT